MLFSSLRTSAFRNLRDAETFTEAKDVFLIGENGQGKTNFLEALYFCAYASSFRSVRDSEMARNASSGGEKDFSAAVKISQSVNDEILVKYEKGKKSIFINRKHTEDRKELLSIAPCIVFCHEDMEFVSGSPERRRWFFDQTLSLYDPVYLEDLRRFRRVLKTRNTVLREYSQNHDKTSAEKVLDALDPQFAMYGQKLMEKRETAAEQFSGIFGPLYEEVSGISGITVQYISFRKNDRNKDLAAGISLSGPHRDRYLFAHNGIEFAGNASTGQRRLLALLLRTAQARRYSQMTFRNPVLLLDDVLLEMDGEKRRRFLTVLPFYDQAFYTFLPEEPYQRYRKEDTLVYNVDGGCVSQ
ncbi:MAG: DNA replication and repair protein RecF [Treponema sp.]|nr:DNA replication and repair protein RecF [Treponema sp.]MCL2272385.1 DNA replication and repair protein RecF [Treponema sp.]